MLWGWSATFRSFTPSALGRRPKTNMLLNLTYFKVIVARCLFSVNFIVFQQVTFLLTCTCMTPSLRLWSGADSDCSTVRDLEQVTVLLTCIDHATDAVAAGRHCLLEHQDTALLCSIGRTAGLNECLNQSPGAC